MTFFQRRSTSSIAFALVLLIIGLVLVAGCTSLTSTGSQSTLSAGAAVQAVNSGKLVALLPAAPAGWKLGDYYHSKPTGETMPSTSTGLPWTLASMGYTSTANKDTMATIVIQDTGNQAVGFKSTLMSDQLKETTKQSFKSTRVKGYPAWEYSAASDESNGLLRSGIISVNDRFMVMVRIDGGTKADYDTFVNAIDFAGIAALK